MNKDKLKIFVRKVLLEKLNSKPRVQGKLLKKTISFSGIQRECVCEGTIEDANSFATEHNLEFKIQEDSQFGGHFHDEMTSYEFQPNPEYYGELMETSMSAREQLARICGTNDQVLTEVDATGVEDLVNFICEDADFTNSHTNLVFEHISNLTENKMYDKFQFKKLFEYLINQSCKIVAESEIELTESENEYATQLLFRRFFANKFNNTETQTEESTKCGKKSFSSGTAFENMQRIVSGHNMFL